MSESDYRLRDQEVMDDQRDKWLAMRAADLRLSTYQLVKALNEIHGEDLFACLTTLVTASKLGTTNTVIEGWINMIVQDEDTRGEWRDREYD